VDGGLEGDGDLDGEDGFGAAAARLRDYTQHANSAVLVEPATARALARFIGRGLTAGGLDAQEVERATELSGPELLRLAHRIR